MTLLLKQHRLLLLLLAAAVVGCAAKRLDLGADAVEPWPDPPRSADGGLDETTPFVIVPHQSQSPTGFGSFALATDGTRLFWTNLHGVHSCVIDNCRSTLLRYGYSGLAYWVGVAGPYVWWGAPLKHCPVEGCASEAVQGVFTGEGPMRVALDDAHVYWSTSSATVLRCPHSGCVGSPELVALLPTWHVVAMAVGASEIVVATWNFTEGRILVVPKDGSADARDIVQLKDEPTSLAIDGSRAYWTTPSDGTVRACPLSGCAGAPDLIATGQRKPIRLAVDDRNAYWINPQDHAVLGDVMECPLEGCGSTPRVLASGQPTLGDGLVLDATHVYWTNEGSELVTDMNQSIFDGDIRRVGK